MASITNPFKKAALVDQLDDKLNELHETSATEAASARSLAELAAEAQQASDVAHQQAIAVNRARGILLDAGVTL